MPLVGMLAARPWGSGGGPPIDLLVTDSHHSGSKCRTYLNANLSALAPPGSHDTHRIIQTAVCLVVDELFECPSGVRSSCARQKAIRIA